MPKRRMTILEALTWAFTREHAFKSLSVGVQSEARGYGNTSSTGRIANMGALGTKVDQSNASTSFAATNTHHDAETLAHALLAVTSPANARWIASRIERGLGEPEDAPETAKAMIDGPEDECAYASTPKGWPPARMSKGRGRPTRKPSMSQMIEYEGGVCDQERAENELTVWKSALADLSVRVRNHLDTIELVQA